MAGLCEGGNEPPGSLKATKRPPVEETASFLQSLLASHGPNYLEKLFGSKARDALAPLGGVEKVAIALSVLVSESKDTGLKVSNSENPTYERAYERIPNLTGEQSDDITVFRIPPMTSLMLHRCRTGAINLQRWWQSPSAAISESDWILYRAGISRRITSCTVVSWRCVLL
ncbi:hypothetical protein ANN_06007 [Periplaneta americana]|uniref:Uncharacterized protein n=1 Tax=Periplaneta americana TaxID=6978 RepID=A0ABQ8TDM3_PERAM|nr:hypothetical protein ANN_06007 [Periplaneta americana]